MALVYRWRSHIWLYDATGQCDVFQTSESCFQTHDRNLSKRDRPVTRPVDLHTTKTQKERCHQWNSKSESTCRSDKRPLTPLHAFLFGMGKQLFNGRQGSAFVREYWRRQVVALCCVVRIMPLHSCLCCETWWYGYKMRQWKMSAVTHFNGKFCFLEILALL